MAQPRGEPEPFEGAMIARPDKNCYCNLWNENPEALRSQGLPEGYCGFCDTDVNGRPCGKPGHMHSGPGPFTVGYCDEHPPGHVVHFGCLVLGMLLVGGIGALFWWLW